MIEWLYSIDLALFRFGNSVIANPVGDAFFPFITELKNFYVVYALAAIGLLAFGRKKGATALLLLAVTIALTDQISSHLIKPLVGRIRPCHVLEGVRLLVGCGGGKSFTSSHAANNFAMAVMLLHFFPRARIYLLVWASLVALSRVYIGVHYPSDIAGGAIVGSLIAIAVIFAYEKAVIISQHRKDQTLVTVDDQSRQPGRIRTKEHAASTTGHMEDNDADV